MTFYKKLFKTVVGKVLLFGMTALSIAFGIVFALKCDDMVLALLLWILSTVSVITLFFFAMIVIILIAHSRRLKTSQELKERVKVISKRQVDISVSDDPPSLIDYITFEFSDGSSEEITVGVCDKNSIYYSTDINDTGVLTYNVLTLHKYSILTVIQEEELEKKFIAFVKDE